MSKPVRLVEVIKATNNQGYIAKILFDDGYVARLYLAKFVTGEGWKYHQLMHSAETLTKYAQDLIDLFPDYLSKAIDIYRDLARKKSLGAFLHVWPDNEDC